MHIELELFDPNYWMFNLGISLNRFEEYDKQLMTKWVRKQFVIGLLVLNININWKLHKEKMTD